MQLPPPAALPTALPAAPTAAQPAVQPAVQPAAETAEQRREKEMELRRRREAHEAEVQQATTREQELQVIQVSSSSGSNRYCFAKSSPF